MDLSKENKIPLIRVYIVVKADYDKYQDIESMT